ncbi:hypothetical protein C8R45DRAFT_1098945 [Mycena sanguinolenta]|nr:hypothetical protein C8R45DRAFT_1098945 [Mycena sanguinolenta]
MPIQTRSRTHASTGTVPETTSPSPSPNSESNRDSDREGSEDKGNKGSDVDSGDEKGDSEEDELEDEGDVDDPGPNPTQAQNARSPPWQPWQDRLLITQVDADRPFQQLRRSRRSAWDATADSMGSASAQQGPNSYFTRSGEACKARFKFLAKKYKVRQTYERQISDFYPVKADQARSLQKTGTDEEIDGFMELLGELCSLMDTETATAGISSKKTNLETVAGLELRDASMKGLVKGDQLVDVTTLEGASVRERQAHTRKNDDNKENGKSRNARCKRRKRTNTALDDVLNQRIEEDKAALEACSKQDAEKHAQQMAVLTKLADCMQGINDRLSGLQNEQEKTNHYLHQQELERREAAVPRHEQELGICMLTCIYTFLAILLTSRRLHQLLPR